MLLVLALACSLDAAEARLASVRATQDKLKRERDHLVDQVNRLPEGGGTPSGLYSPVSCSRRAWGCSARQSAEGCSSISEDASTSPNSNPGS